MNQTRPYTVINKDGGRHYYSGKHEELSFEEFLAHEKAFESHRLPSCPIEPMPGRVVVQPEAESSGVTRLKSGLFSVSIGPAESRPTSATIVAIGDNTDEDADSRAISFNLGDTVMFTQHAGVRVGFGERGEEKYIVLKASEIIARIVERGDGSIQDTKGEAKASPVNES